MESPFPYITWMISWLWGHPTLQSVIETCVFYRSMWKTWGTSSCWKGGGTFHQPHLLGITLDTSQMEIRSPDEKLLHICNKILIWLPKKNATKREILSLIGLLQHAMKVVRCGRTFVGRIYQAAAKVKELSFFTCLTKEFRSYLFWWHFFLTG